MTKRIVSKIGNIYCTEIDNQYKVYLQYIAKDLEQLNSTVIRVFKKRYPINYEPILEDIVKDDIDFYAHVMLNNGIRDGVWYKVGTHNDLGDTENICFRTFSEGNYQHLTKSHRWYVWKINKPPVFIGELSNKYRHYEIGWVFPYNQILSRIKTGNYTVRLLD